MKTPVREQPVQSRTSPGRCIRCIRCEATPQRRGRQARTRTPLCPPQGNSLETFKPPRTLTPLRPRIANGRGSRDRLIRRAERSGLGCTTGRLIPNRAKTRMISIRAAQLSAQSGQVAIEYLLLTVFVALVLWGDGGQALNALLSSIQSHYAAFTYGMSLP